MVATVPLALSLVFSVLFVARFFGESFFVLHERSMVQTAVSGVLVSELLDPFIWGVCVVLVSVWLLWGFILESREGRWFRCFVCACFLRAGGFVGFRVWCFAFGFG